MSNSLNIQANLTVTKSSGGAVIGSQSIAIAPASSGYIDEPQTVATGSWQALTAVATLASTPGMCMFKNVDTTGAVTIATDNAGANVVAVLVPGGMALLQPVSHTLYAEATTNSCVLQTTGTNL